MPDEIKPKRKKRGICPPMSAEAWTSLGNTPWREMDPGLLADLLDHRPTAELDDLGADVIERLMVIVRETLESFLPGDRHRQRRHDAEGRICDHLLKRNGPISFRTHFLRSIYTEAGKVNQDLDRAEEKPHKTLRGSIVEPWLSGRSDFDSHEVADLKIKLAKLLDDIPHERHRRAVSMHLLENSHEEIAAILKVTAPTIGEWVAKYLPKKPPLIRMRPGMRARHRQTRKGRPSDGQ